MRRLNASLLCTVIAIGCASRGAEGEGNDGDGGGMTVAGAGAGGTSGASGTNGAGGTGAGGTSGGGEGGGGSGASAGIGGIQTAPLPRSCGMACEPGFMCEYVAVQCVRAPCPPQPMCVERPSCGDSTVSDCPGAGQCGDDPRTGCQHGGNVTCPGLCSCFSGGPICMPGQRWNPSVFVCACEPNDTGGE